MTLNDLQDFRQRDLYAMLRLPDEEFQDRLVSMGLLNGSMDCTCGLPMKKKESSRGVLEWQCNRAIHRPSKPTKGFKVGTFFERSELGLKAIFELSYMWARNVTRALEKRADFESCHFISLKSMLLE